MSISVNYQYSFKKQSHVEYFNSNFITKKYTIQKCIGCNSSNLTWSFISSKMKNYLFNDGIPNSWTLHSWIIVFFQHSFLQKFSEIVFLRVGTVVRIFQYQFYWNIFLIRNNEVEFLKSIRYFDDSFFHVIKVIRIWGRFWFASFFINKQWIHSQNCLTYEKNKLK